ncbi:MAG: ECF-type sigma factor [Planctomycetota bacterium]
MPDETQITRLLQRAGDGDPNAASDLLPLVYEELRSLAAARMGRLPPGQTLQPTALVHEAFMRSVGHEDAQFENRRHFFFVAARAMRDILVEDARRKSRLKRGGDLKKSPLEGLSCGIDAPAEDMLALDEAMSRLEDESPRLHRLVMLRFFAGLTVEQAAELMEIAERTASRDWRIAKARLHALMSGDTSDTIGSDP